ncbi:phage holin family protein [Aromatoleum anaerobium]|uniref:Transmembrane protein n=1 Tax=Aromatoleum anaerobium TaxID=182180 RepID=A0ABX1PNN1_9RHOO|nr:phage holin family protein [Aromatoleum anaerobium]MCK0506027.1 phage holin family protein [Aromatoleum anaerobium]
MPEDSRPRLAASLRGLLDSGLGIVQSRLELLVVEVQEEKLRLAGLLLNIVLTAVLVGFGVVFLAIFLTVLFWEEHRLLALGLGTVALFGAGLFTASNAAADLRRGTRLFAASLAELTRDREAVRHKE